MKKIFEIVISFILTLIILAGLLFIGVVVYKIYFDTDSVSTMHTEDALVTTDSGTEIIQKVEKKSIGDTIKDLFVTKEPEPIYYSPVASQGKYYYEQLNETQKTIYNGLQENKKNLMSGTFTIEFGSKFTSVLVQENGSKTLGDDYQTAIEAFTHDNTDLFFLDVSKMYLNIETKKKAFKTTYNVYIQPEEGETYFAKGFNSESDVQVALKKIENVRDTVKARLTGNLVKDIKGIHDYLIDNIEYDQELKSIGTYTIYGALVEKRAVCEGYARSFKYLADMAGIKCVLMQGTAINTEGKSEKHAWNGVCINGVWYLIDSTWDDPIIIGKGIVMGNTHYRYYLKGTKNFYKDHTPEFQFSEGGKRFKYPDLSVSDY